MNLQEIMERALGGARPSLPEGTSIPPKLSGSLPLIGHLGGFLRQPLHLLARAHKEQGEVAWLEIGPKKLCAIFGPEGHEAVFRAPDTLLNPQDAYSLMTPIFGEGIIYDASVEVMGEQVRMLLPALKDRRMRTYAEAIVKEVEESISDWGDEGVVDLVEYCRVLTNFTSSRCLLGAEFREQMNEEFAKIYHDLEQGITPIAYLNPYLPLPSFKRRDRARVKLVGLVDEIMGARRNDDREGDDFLQTLMDSKYSDGRELTGAEVTGLLLAAMFAGHHTSSVATAWTLLELLQDRRYMEKVIGQVDEVFGDGAPFTMKNIRNLTFADRAVKEVLRMHPPLFMLVRVAQEDWTFKDYFIPKGTWIVVSPTVSHMSDRYFENPDEFDPDRFSPEREEDIDKWAYIPFGGGRHKCLGNAFAMLQIKTILAILLSTYEFDLRGDAIEDDFQSMVIGPKGPCRLRYRRRQPNAARARADSSAAPTATESAEGCPFHDTTPTPQVELQVVIDKDLCQGHSVCTGEASDVFGVGEDGKVELRVEHIQASMHQSVREAVQYCPNGALSLKELPLN